MSITQEEPQYTVTWLLSALSTRACESKFVRNGVRESSEVIAGVLVTAYRSDESISTEFAIGDRVNHRVTRSQAEAELVALVTVRDAAEAVTAREAQLARAIAARDEAIRAAAPPVASMLKHVTQASGLTRSRVHQILRQG